MMRKGWRLDPLTVQEKERKQARMANLIAGRIELLKLVHDKARLDKKWLQLQDPGGAC